ncbi:MAG: hypothetical protein ACSHW0_07275 [Thalassotalea sp.]
MEWLLSLLESLNFQFIAVLIPTLLVVCFFAYAAHKAHLRHLERIKKIKQGYLFSEEE